jgi:hypothetical protein
LRQRSASPVCRQSVEFWEEEVGGGGAGGQRSRSQERGGGGARAARMPGKTTDIHIQGGGIMER